jgi:hypothetical protein
MTPRGLTLQSSTKKQLFHLPLDLSKQILNKQPDKSNIRMLLRESSETIQFSSILNSARNTFNPLET